MLVDEESRSISTLERHFNKKINLRSLAYFHIEQYEVIDRPKR